MNSRTIIVGLALLAFALLLGMAIRSFNQQPPVVAAPEQKTSDQHSTNAAALAALEEVDRLRTEHAWLSGDLNAANQENTRLEKLNQKAEHAARLFKELAAQSDAQGRDPTNVYPTIRHALAGAGKQARLAAEMEVKWGDVDGDRLPPEEQKAAQQAMLGIASEMLRLRQALEQEKTNLNEEFPQPATPEAMADYCNCYAYGALGLDHQQFSSVYSILERYYSQAVQQDLLQSKSGESDEAKANRLAALDQLNASASAEIQPLLSPQQLALLSRSPLKQLKFVTAKFYPLGFGIAFGAPPPK